MSDFQSCFVYLELEFVGNAFKSKFACAFEEHHGIRERSKARTCEKIIGMVEAFHLTLQKILQTFHFVADADDFVHRTRCNECCHALIEFASGHARLLKIAQHKHRFMVRFFATMQEIEGNVERCEIGIVSIVDERQPTHPRFHLKTHCHRLK